MAELSLILPIFVASSSDVMPEREAADKKIMEAQREVSERRLVLEPYNWVRHAIPVAGAPQPPIAVQLRRAELVVVILWGRIGPGAERELTEALDQARRGETDNVMIYFKSAPPPPGEDPEADKRNLARVEEIHKDLRRNNLALTWEFSSTEDFKEKFAHHLRIWLQRWNCVPACCQFALENCPTVKGTAHLGESRLGRLEQAFDLGSLVRIQDYLGKEAVTRYQNAGEEGVRQGLAAKTLRELDSNWHTALASPAELRLQGPAKPLQGTQGGEVWFADMEWFYYFCALGLAEAIQRGDFNAVERRPYVNPIHQYLSALVQLKHLKIEPMLRRWLTNKDGVTDGKAVVRNFAAYELGMIRAYDAQEDLATALALDKGKDVSTYCITSLGKLRSRLYFPTLMQMFQRELDPMRRMLLSQAVCNIVGIAPYDL